MISLQKRLNKNELAVYSVSILIHGMLLLALLFVGIKYYHVKEIRSVVQFVEVTPSKPAKIERSKSMPVKQKIQLPSKIIPVKIHSAEKEISSETLIDSNKIKKKVDISEQTPIDSTELRLKFARTMLDTFLIRNPEFAHYILKQQAKYLMQNQTQRMLTRMGMEKKINNELHKYIQDNFPEGSEHAMSETGGPGMQIPIDGLIDAIKKIFQ